MFTGRFPSLTSREFIRTMHRLGFETIRQTGSHVIIRHPDGRCVVVPDHGSKDLRKGFAKKLIREAQVKVSDFLAAL